MIRARALFLAAEKIENSEIDERLNVSRSFVSELRKRFCRERLEALEDRSRSGRPARFPLSELAAVKAVACELPAQMELPFSRFSIREVRRVVLDRSIVGAIGATTLGELLHEEGIRPWNHHSWIFPRDPEFFDERGHEGGRASGDLEDRAAVSGPLAGRS